MNVIASFTATCSRCGQSETLTDVPFGMKAEHDCAAGTWSLRKRGRS